MTHSTTTGSGAALDRAIRVGHFDFGRGDLASFEDASGREWLVTNGLGAYAAGTLADANTRRYHGMLVAALQPPLGRAVVVAKLEATADYGGVAYALSCNAFADGTIAPRGYRHIERFGLESGLPVWEYALGDALLERRILMPYGRNTTLVRYRLLRGSHRLRLVLRPLCTYRDYHSHTHGGWDFIAVTADRGFCIQGYMAARPCYLRADRDVEVFTENHWHWSFHHGLETQRGLDDREDLFAPGGIVTDLNPGDAVTVSLSLEERCDADFEAALAAEQARRRRLLARVPSAIEAPWEEQLVYAADQFIVTRSTAAAGSGHTVIAGYPWFGDWGRDTMIALPGLTLATGRYDVAGSILRTFARYLDRGMLPNRFPDQGEKPEYNTVDATLWYVHSVHAYTQASGDLSLAESVFDGLLDIVDWHRRGTRYGIQVDPADGLLRAGEAGVQLSWMDAKVGDWVVTPRTGKAVEVNALWYELLCCIGDLAAQLQRRAIFREYMDAAGEVRASFARFWNAERRCLFDVIDGDTDREGAEGRRHDDRLRPNQIFAVSLPHSPLASEQQRAVVDICAAQLVTSHGLRSLAPQEADYRPVYRGGTLARDGAYHQGTVWAWLLPPFAEAHYRVYGDAILARSFLRPLAGHLREACIGSISEIFDGDSPHTGRGCFAQAWSVSELLRVWFALAERS